jgi:hypothetical protein
VGDSDIPFNWNLVERIMKINKVLGLAFMLGSFTLLSQQASAQSSESDKPLKLGLKFGIPVTDSASASNTDFFGGGSQLPGGYSAGTPRYILGASAEFRLPYKLRFEVDGLYRRAGFNNNTGLGTIGSYQTTSYNDWQIPGLFKYNLSLGHFRPFVEAGASFRHVSTLTTRTYGPQIIGALGSDNAPELRNRNSFGGVAGFGMTFKTGFLELTPEARYTRWANSVFIGNGLRSNLDQGDILLGITF